MQRLLATSHCCSFSQSDRSCYQARLALHPVEMILKRAISYYQRNGFLSLIQKIPIWLVYQIILEQKVKSFIARSKILTTILFYVRGRIASHSSSKSTKIKMKSPRSSNHELARTFLRTSRHSFSSSGSVGRSITIKSEIPCLSMRVWQRCLLNSPLRHSV